MMRISSLTFATLLVLCCCLFASPAAAQTQNNPYKAMSPADRTGVQIALDLSPALRTVAQASGSETAAVVPWLCLHGTQGAEKAAGEFLTQVLAQGDFAIVPGSSVNAACADLAMSDRTELPSPQQLLRLGQRLGVDWVIAARADWRSRSIRIGPGPKTSSVCTVDMLIVDVRYREVALDAHQVRMNSTAGERMPQTLLSGGPKTPQAQRDAQLAIARAIQPWFDAYSHNLRE